MDQPKPIKISDELAKEFIDHSNLDTRELCTALSSVYVGTKRCEGVYTITDVSIGEPSIYGKIYQACCKDDCSYVAKWQKDKKMAKEEADIQYLVAKQGLAPHIREILVCDKGTIIIMDALTITAMRIITSLSKTQRDVTQKYYQEKIQPVLNILKEKGEDVQDIEQLLNDEITDFSTYHNMRGKINKLCWKHIGSGCIESIDIQVPDTKEQKELKIKTVNQIFILLNKLHHMGITHKDTHLNNFMSKGVDPQLYLIDFGLAKFTYDKKDREYDYQRFIRDIRKFSNEDGYVNLNYLLDFAEKEYKVYIAKENKEFEK